MEDEKKEYERIVELIINSILKLVFSGFIIYKLWDFSITINNFDYLYFLSTVIAIFAIVLSVLFYFKSTEQSNKFYDNIFKFTKDTSNILAEMKTGLGHLEKVVYKSPIDNSKENEKEKIEQKNKEIEEKSKEVDEQITKLLEDNGLKEDTIKQLKNELLMQSKRYSELEKNKQILTEELNSLKNGSQALENHIFKYLTIAIKSNHGITKDDVRLLSKVELRDFCNEVIQKEKGEFIKDAESLNIVNNNEITRNGLYKFRDWIMLNL